MARRPKGGDGRRKPGTGYATQADNGTWIGHFPKSPRGYHVRRGFNTRTAAEAWCDSLLARQQDKEDVGKGQQRLSAWLDQWKTREAREREWKAKMVADVEWKLGYVKPYLGDKAIADVMPDDVDAMLDELARDLAMCWRDGDMADDYGLIGGDQYEGGPYCEQCEQELEWEECYECGGEGFIDGDRLMEEDPLWYSKDDMEECGECQGHGGWHYCANPQCGVIRVAVPS